MKATAPYLDETEVGAMAGENKKSEYRNAWIAEKLDRVNLTMPKGKKAVLQDYAATVGMSVNAYINEAIDEKMERDSVQEVAE